MTISGSQGSQAVPLMAVSAPTALPSITPPPPAKPMVAASQIVESRPAAPSFFFFPRLPIGQYGPVSQLSRSEESCTGPFNWGEAHCAGEKVKRKIGPFLRKSLKNQTRTRTQQKGRSPPRQPGTPWPGSQVHGPTRKQTQQARDFTNKS